MSGERGSGGEEREAPKMAREKEDFIFLLMRVRLGFREAKWLAQGYWCITGQNWGPAWAAAFDLVCTPRYWRPALLYPDPGKSHIPGLF